MSESPTIKIILQSLVELCRKIPKNHSETLIILSKSLSSARLSHNVSGLFFETIKKDSFNVYLETTKTTMVKVALLKHRTRGLGIVDGISKAYLHKERDWKLVFEKDNGKRYQILEMDIEGKEIMIEIFAFLCKLMKILEKTPGIQREHAFGLAFGTDEKNLDAESESLFTEDTDENNGLCISCFEIERETIFQPCNHFAMCENCSKNWFEKKKTCPVCRQKSHKITKVYMC